MLSLISDYSAGLLGCTTDMDCEQLSFAVRGAIMVLGAALLALPLAILQTWWWR